MSALTRLLWLRRFARSERGNIAMTFGVAMIPIMTLISVGVDYGRAANARSAMQAAIDAATLMLAKQAPGMTAADLTAKANAYFKAILNRPDISGISVVASYSGSPNRLTLSTKGSINNAFLAMPAFGNSKLSNISTSASVQWSSSRYRVAFALDNTRSMLSASKLTELKKAAKLIIESFATMAASDDDVYISLVPFAVDVNIGTSQRSASWINWTSWDAGTIRCKYPDDKVQNNYPSIYASSQSRKSTCELYGGTYNDVSDRSDWTGCVVDRNQDYDTKNDPPTSTNSATMVIADRTSCSTSMLGMTPVFSKKQTLLNKIDAMFGDGGTNQAIGIAWAWMTHRIGDGPFPAPAKNPGSDYIDAVILLTDGANSQNRWTTVQKDIDDRQAILCKNIKDAKITLFAIQVSTANEPISQVTKNCASDPENPVYYSNITNASEIAARFASIFSALTQLHLSN